MKTEPDANYWEERYADNRTGWDIGYPSPPLTDYLDGLPDKDLRILIPGAGNAYEAEYAWRAGFRNVHVLDIASAPLAALQRRVPDFPAEQLLHEDFLAHEGQYDLILEQTFFCALLPALRPDYAQKMHALLPPGGRLVGLWFNREFPSGPPFGGNKEEYLGHLTTYFEVISFSPATNSIAPRAGAELFGVFQKPQ